MTEFQPDLIRFVPLEVLIYLRELIGTGEVFLAKNASSLRIGEKKLGSQVLCSNHKGVKVGFINFSE